MGEEVSPLRRQIWNKFIVKRIWQWGEQGNKAAAKRNFNLYRLCIKISCRKAFRGGRHHSNLIPRYIKCKIKCINIAKRMKI